MKVATFTVKLASAECQNGASCKGCANVYRHMQQRMQAWLAREWPRHNATVTLEGIADDAASPDKQENT